MKYRFIGKPDRIFPYLVTGKVYDLTIESQNFTPVIVRPFVCPYTSWNAFLQNWGPVKTTKKTAKPIGDTIDVRLEKQLQAARAKVMLMEYGERASYFEKFPLHKEKVIWTGREYLRSINDDRHGWHVLAWGVLIVSLIASAYILTHGLVCASASLEGKTVINCIQK